MCVVAARQMMMESEVDRSITFTRLKDWSFATGSHGAEFRHKVASLGRRARPRFRKPSKRGMSCFGGQFQSEFPCASSSCRVGAALWLIRRIGFRITVPRYLAFGVCIVIGPVIQPPTYQYIYCFHCRHFLTLCIFFNSISSFSYVQ